MTTLMLFFIFIFLCICYYLLAVAKILLISYSGQESILGIHFCTALENRSFDLKVGQYACFLFSVIQKEGMICNPSSNSTIAYCSIVTKLTKIHKICFLSSVLSIYGGSRTKIEKRTSRESVVIK